MTLIVSAWTRDDVARWLRDIGFEKYVDFFFDNNVDGDCLLQLSKEDLFCLAKVFGETFKLGEIVKFEKYLNRLKEIQQPGFPPPGNLDAIRVNTGPVSNEPNWNQGGFEENVRIMESALPDYCWHYKAAGVLFKDFNPLHGAIRGESPVANAFPASATHVISPVEFYVQPNLIQPLVKKMQEQLQDVYSETTAAVPRENIFVGMPCVTRYKEDNNWYRAQVMDVVGVDEAPVKFVDWGNRQYSTFNDLKPLKIEFGRLPPAALQCRIKGVRERTLEQKVLDAFHQEIESLGCEMLVSIVASDSEPFLVDIFNKYTSENIGSKYLPKEPICPKIPSLEALKKKKEQSRAAKEEAGTSTANGEESETKVFACDMDAILEGAIDYSSSEDDQDAGEVKRTNKKIRQLRHEEKLLAQRKRPPKSAEEEERSRIAKLPNIEVPIQRRFRKQRKPLAGVINVLVSHVESTKEIYLRILPLEETTGNVQEALTEYYGDPNKEPPILPTDFVVVDGACVIHEPKDKMWYRCRIAEMSSDGVVLQAVDVGKRFPVISPAEYNRMKVLFSASSLELPPQAFYCRIDQLCERDPTPTESRILRDVLPAGSFMKAEFDRSREPWRVRMWFPDTDRTLVDRFETTVDEMGYRDIIACERRPCTDLAVWQGPQYIPLTTVTAKPTEQRQTVWQGPQYIPVTTASMVEQRQSVWQQPQYNPVPTAKPTEEKRQSPENGECSKAVSSGEKKPVQSTVKAGPGVTATGAAREPKKPSVSHGFVNDIEAVLGDSVAAAGYDSEEENEYLVTAATGRGKRRGGGMVETEDEERDERGSVCEFSQDKKELVTQWLQRASAPGTLSASSDASVRKKPSVAAMYNPDLTRRPPVQPTEQWPPPPTREPHKHTASGSSVDVKRTMTARVPLKAAQVLKDPMPGTSQM